MKRNRRIFPTVLAVVTALLFCALFAPTSSAEEADELRWCPVYYDDGVFFTTGLGESAPKAARDLVVPSYAEEDGEGGYTVMRATGNWNYDRQTGVCKPIYQPDEEAEPLFVVRRQAEKTDGTEVGICMTGYTIADLQEICLFHENGDRAVLLGDVLIPYEGFAPNEKALAFMQNILAGGNSDFPYYSLLVGSGALEIDLNGHMIRQISKKYLFWVHYESAELAVFSSKPGAVLSERDVLGNVASYPTTDDARHFSWSAGIFGVDNLNCRVTVGRFGEYPGSNLTMRGGVMCSCGTSSGSENDRNAYVTFDGVNAHGMIADSSALFVVRTYGGQFSVVNANIYVTVKAGTEYSYVSRPIVHLRTTSNDAPIVDKTVILDNCRIMCASQHNALTNEIDAHGTLVVTNTIGNFDMASDGTLLGKLVVGAGNAFTALGQHANIVCDEGVVCADDRRAVRCDIRFPDPYQYDDTREDGRYFDFSEDTLTLDTLTEIGSGYGTVRIVWSSVDGKHKLTETYVKGGTAVYLGVEIVAETTRDDVTVTVIDGWDGETENLQSDATLKPNVISHYVDVRGLKHNISLSTDFILNLYVPTYKQIADLTDAEGKRLTRVPVEIDGASYEMVSLPIASNAGAELFGFLITVDDGVDFLTQTVSFSLASYAEAAFAEEGVTAAEKSLIAAAVNYAAKSALYFNGAAPETLSRLAEEYAAFLPEAEPDGANRIGRNDIFLGAALELDASPDFVFYLTGKFSGSIRLFLTVDGGQKSKTYTVGAQTGSIVLENVGIRALAEPIELQAKANNASSYTTVGRYDLAAYLLYCRAGGVSPEMLALAEALWQYVAAAKAVV